MRAGTFLWVMALYGVIAFCCVQESARQTRLRYGLARALAEEETLRERLEGLHAEEARLCSTVRLMELNESLSLGFAPMGVWRGR